MCTEVPNNPNDLPDIIESLIGSTLESLTLTVDGTPTAISNAEIDPDLPHPGAVDVDYATTAQDLTPGAATPSASPPPGATSSTTRRRRRAA